MHAEFLPRPLVQTVTYTLCSVLMCMLAFVVLEPVTSRAITNTFAVRQLMTAEISFLATSTGVTMAGSIAGLTGGNATGSTYVVVQTNQTTGYTMDISFSGTPAMRGDTTGNSSIVNYGTTSEPTYGFFASTSAVFAYNVASQPTGDLDLSFKNNGSSCNAGAGYTASTCWMGPSTTDFRIISRSSAAGTGVTTTLQFRVNVPNNPNPAVQSDFYTATATLTALTQ